MSDKSVSTALEEAGAIVGSQALLARKLEVSRQTFHQWKVQESVPPKYCPSIEKFTGGKVKCERFHPDIDWAYLRAS